MMYSGVHHIIDADYVYIACVYTNLAVMLEYFCPPLTKLTVFYKKQFSVYEFNYIGRNVCLLMGLS